MLGCPQCWFMCRFCGGMRHTPATGHMESHVEELMGKVAGLELRIRELGEENKKARELIVVETEVILERASVPGTTFKVCCALLSDPSHSVPLCHCCEFLANPNIFCAAVTGAIKNSSLAQRKFCPLPPPLKKIETFNIVISLPDQFGWTTPLGATVRDLKRFVASEHKVSQEGMAVFVQGTKPLPDSTSGYFCLS